MIHSEKPADLRSFLEGLGEDDFQKLGVEHFAYIRPFNGTDDQQFAVYGADGRLIAVMESMDKAVKDLQAGGIHAVTVH